MTKRILCYWLAVLVTIYCFFMYNDKTIKTLLIIEIIYFVVSLFSLIMVQRKVKASLVSKSLIAEKNKEIPIIILVENLSKIPAVHFDVILRMENTFTGEVVKHRAHGVVDSENEKRMTISLYIKECGNLRITLEKIEIYDRFFVLKKEMKSNIIEKRGDAL